jgi:hypothetical protein
MSDIIDINVSKTVETIDIVANFEHPNIEITAIESVDNVEVNAVPNVVQVNINTVIGSGAEWGEIDGTLSDQTDLQDALDLKANTSELGAVAFSNDYNDLDNLPTIPEAVTKTSDLINDGEDGVNPFITLEDVTNGTVTSVGLTMPSAFTVTNSPITSSGDIAVTGAGLVSQYVRGDGTLANFPNSTGGGSSVNYYLNGSVNQGTIGGVTYYEMSRTPILDTGADFQINTNGYIASFLTDANDPSLLEIPAGNWNFETYFQASSGGGSPRFYIELYKYNGTTFSLIASNSTTPKLINDGTNIEAYYSALAVPQTTLLATDRLAVRIYVITSGRTITLHTENGHLCQVLTTFTTGLTALNGLTQQVQYFNVGTGATNFNISSSGDTHTFNLLTNIRRNAQSSNINYCGYAPNGSLENQAVWTITKITVATNGSVTTTTSNNVTWTSVPF